jgi:hypothetical protein
MAQNQAHTYADEQVQLLSSVNDLTIKKVRGKYVISTMPTYKFFGIPGTLLECQDCMDDATWRGVLIGACQDCQQKYSGEGILIGFDEKVYIDAMPGYSNAAPFGFYSGFAFDVCLKINELLEEGQGWLNGMKRNIPLDPRAIKTADAYSFYGLAQLSLREFNTMLNTPTAYTRYATRYNIYRHHIRYDGVFEAIEQLANAFDLYDPEFYKLCQKTEKEWTLCSEASTQAEVDAEMLLLRKQKEEEEKQKKEKQKEKVHVACHYCGDIKPTKKCGQCLSVRYCSVACQSRDWHQGGAYECVDGELSTPHKEVCEYLMGLRQGQEQWEGEWGGGHDEDELFDSE